MYIHQSSHIQHWPCIYTSPAISNTGPVRLTLALYNTGPVRLTLALYDTGHGYDMARHGYDTGHGYDMARHGYDMARHGYGQMSGYDGYGQDMTGIDRYMLKGLNN